MSDEKNWDIGDKSVNKPKKESRVSNNLAIDQILPNTDAIQGPVVVFVGPPSIGKTVVLLRLAEYLRSNENITMSVNREFRSDPTYEEVINEFETSIARINVQPPRTESIGFCLVDVVKDQKPLCQILEAPGEHFFNDSMPNNKQFRNYLNRVLFDSSYKKIVVLFFEQNMLETPEMRKHYANRMKQILNKLNLKRDKVITLYNKVDRDFELFRDGVVNRKAIKDRIFNNDSYAQFRIAIDSNRNLKKVMFLPFSSGNFYEIDGDDAAWGLGNDSYPRELWKYLTESIKKTKWSIFG